ncbi:MAG: serine hydroxymethyltransferase, partial [Proteobacteria bacterium]|nr:serine hydroxymethyltransferase [Pseudomonadota bacterium]
EKPFIVSGIRVGSPAGTTRGFGVAEFELIGGMMTEVLDGLAANPEGNAGIEQSVKNRVVELCRKFPIYPDL